MAPFYLDTEFTDLDEPNLLSIGMLLEDGTEFYAELELATDYARDRMQVTSDFVQEVVLPHWGRIPGAACSHQEMGRRAGALLLGLASRHGCVEVLSDCRLDFELLEGALRHANALKTLRAVITSRTIASVVESPDGQREQASEFERIAHTRGLVMHHALADALALRASNRASIELSAMRGRLGITDVSAQVTNEQLAADSGSAKDAWVHDGIIIEGRQLAEAWSCSRQALEQLRERNELSSMEFRGQCWYPAAMAEVSAADAGQVSAALRETDSVSQVIFWMRRHGGLGGATVAETIAHGRLSEVVQLANLLSIEY